MHALSWVWRTIGLLLVLLLLVAGLVALSELLREPSVTPQPIHRIDVVAARVWFVLLGVLVAILVLLAAWRAVGAGVRWFALSLVFGESGVVRMVGLGLAALVFPQALWALLNAPLIVVIELFRNVPERTRAVISALYSGSGSGDMPLDATLLRLVDLLQLVGSELARTLDRAVQPIPLVDATLALALWALAAQALRGMAPDAGNGTETDARPPRIVRAFLRLRGEHRYLLGLGSVLLVSSFLSVASIVAIPWLKDDKVPAGLNREDLQVALEGLGRRADDLDALLPGDLGARVSPFAVLDATPPVAPEAGASGAAPNPDPMAGYGRQLLARTQETRQHALQRAARMREELPQQQERIVKRALQAFATESTQPMSAQERLFFFRAIQRQVGEMLAEQAQALVSCRADIEEADRDAAFASRAAAGSMFRQGESVGDPQWGPLMVLVKSTSAYERACARVPLRSAEFVPPEAGSGWGPFGRMANWLLRTKSLALALITGMLGFGLLGAAISTFVRSRQQTSPASDLGDVGRVVVRGLSAAVVLFLAVKGGLAVLTVGEQEPNAYVLFFLCLVGAVFSEDVWTWARRKFLGRLGDEQRPPGSATGTEPKGGLDTGAPASKPVAAAPRSGD